MTSTTILIDKELRDELRSLGGKGETYDDILKRLIREAKKK